ncbi:cytochrome P450 [Saccharopolyspora hattusasensis]|uniref:cytochrome P450 n=1 Tax=Saccharopolyspora hattusasensis TaxID=1128679 RepID=UPI003D98DC01
MLDIAKSSIPGPNGEPWDVLARFNEDTYGYLDELFAVYGTLFSLPLGNVGGLFLPHINDNGNWVFLTRPHQIKVMYESPDDVISGAEANKIFFGTDEASVAYIEGKAHRKRRQQLHPFGGSRDYAELVLAELARQVETWPKGTPFRLFEKLQIMTSAIITEVVCGNMAEEDREFIRTTLLHTENAKNTGEEVLAADAGIRSLVARRIPDYRVWSAPESPDTLSLLLRLAEEGDVELTDEVIRDEVFSLLYTGFSTTANTLAWTFVRLLRDERVLGSVRKEIADNIGDGTITRDSVNTLPYLDAVLKEVLRLHPVTALNGVRLLKQDIELDGYQVPAGSILVHCAYLLQRSSEVFDAATEFQPERFLTCSVDRYRWGAFGGGSRTCLGRGFSMNEMKLVVTKLLTDHELRAVGVGVPKAQLQGFFMAPIDGALVEMA